MERTILHADANCFYASVEMLHHPEYDFPDELVEPAARMFFRLAQGTIS